MQELSPVVIVGAGHAGCQVAFSLRQSGYGGRLVLLNAEAAVPYQRPPLSKAFLTGAVDETALAFKPLAMFGGQNIELLNAAVLSIDRAGKKVTLSDGQALDYGHLVIATGARARSLPVPGVTLAGVHALRTLDDAQRLKPCLTTARRAVVIGAGFIGLEFAAVAAIKGLSVHVIEALDRPMARAASPAVSAHFVRAHQSWGVEWSTGCSVREIAGNAGRVSAVVTSDGRELPADVVVYGVGVHPNVELAREAGLDVADGIVVDELLATSDPAISAIGDAAAFPSPHTGRRMRLESVQNALDQARSVAARLVGDPKPFNTCPWFWSDQGDRKLQIAGLALAGDEFVDLSPDASSHALVLGFRGGQLTVVETVNQPAEHMLARRVLGGPKSLTPRMARAAGFDFKAWAKS